MHQARTLASTSETLIQHHGSSLCRLVPTALEVLAHDVHRCYGIDVLLIEFRFAESFGDNFTTLADQRFDQSRIDLFTG